MIQARPLEAPTTPSSRQLVWLAAAVVVVLVVLGCAPRAPLETYDLVHSYPAAHEVPPVLRVDFGTSESRPALLSGWSWNETAEDGTHFVWAVGSESRVGLSLNGLRPTELLLRLQPYQPSEPTDEDPAVLEISLGDISIAELELETGFATYRLGVDPELWPPTDALLRLRQRPAPAPARDARRLAAAWDWLELGFAGERPPRPPATTAHRDRIELDPGGRLDYPVDLEVGSRLEIESVSPSPAALIVVLTPRDGEPRPHHVAGGSRLDLDLEVERLTVATLSLVAAPEALAPGQRLVLERPRIVRPRPEPHGSSKPLDVTRLAATRRLLRLRSTTPSSARGGSR